MTARTLAFEADFIPQDAVPSLAPLVDRIPPIPERKTVHGPLTARRLYRFYAMLGLVFLIGVAPMLLGMSAQWKAFGFGLIFPGAGFLYAGDGVGILGAALSMAAFAVIMFIWWARGVILAPPAVLVGTALLSAAWIEGRSGISWMEWAIPAAVLALHGWFALGRRKGFAAAKARGA